MSGKVKFGIISSDEQVLVVDKPAGVLCIPGRDTTEPALSDLLKRQFGELFTVHRVDRETSGVVVFARTAQAHRHLSQQFGQRAVRKLYHALVIGHLSPPEQVIDAPLRLTGNGNVVVDPKGKPARTGIRVMEQFRGYALLEACPTTGRQHQIRVHLQHAGHPLIVDPRYHSTAPLTITDIKPGAHIAQDRPLRPLLARTPLHAAQLELQHPDGRQVIFNAPWPKDLRATVNQLRKWRK
ncbi:MAG: RluA family pseudouridine synthase [Saprospiraceae bacterium]|nr:RluA family pseudouridine synthase [Saprospiraceae bacterium]